MQINGKKEERLGWREEKVQSQRFYCILNNRFSETEMLDWSATSQSVNNQKSQSQGSHCDSNFCTTRQTDTGREVHSSFQMEIEEG